MGSYSYFKDEDIFVTNLEGLKIFLEIYKKEYPDWTLWDIIEKDLDGKEIVTFKNWDDIKLINYWYDEELLFLQLVAKYLEGNVKWDYEEDTLLGEVEFKDEECLINTGTIEWVTWKPNDEVDGISSEFKIPDDLKKLMVINELR